jgi:hypothetical protein
MFKTVSEYELQRYSNYNKNITAVLATVYRNARHTATPPRSRDRVPLSVHTTDPRMLGRRVVEQRLYKRNGAPGSYPPSYLPLQNLR